MGKIHSRLSLSSNGPRGNMKLYFIENDKTYDQTFLEKDDVIVCFNYLPYLQFVQNDVGAEVIFVETLFDPEAYNNLHHVTDEFCTKWYISDGKDFSMHKKVSFGEITNVMFNRKYMMGVLVKYGESIRKAIQNYNPELVLCDFSDYGNTFYFNIDDKGRFFSKKKVALSVCDQLGKNLVFLECPKTIPSAWLGAIDLDKKVLKSLNQKTKNLVKKSLAYCLENLVRPINSFILRSRKRIVFENYFNVESLIRCHDVHWFLQSLTNRLAPFFFGCSLLGLKSSMTNLSKQDENFLVALNSRIEQNLSDPHSYTLNAIDYREFYDRVILQLVNYEMPKLIGLFNQLDTKLKTYNIHGMLLIDPDSELSRIKIHACNQNNIISAFMDHGIQGHRSQSSLAKIADFSIIFSAGQHDPYETNKKLEVIGNPSLDRYHYQKRKVVEKIEKILFLTFESNHYFSLDRFCYQEKYVAAIVPLFRKLVDMGIELFFRPHYENREYYEYVFEFFSLKELPFHFVDTASVPFFEQVYKMDMVVSNISNCFFEAQAAGVPTVFFEPDPIMDALTLPFSGKNWDEVIRISDSADLLDLILRNKDDASELRSFLDRFLRVHGQRFMGFLDGKSGERIAACLAKC